MYIYMYSTVNLSIHVNTFLLLFLQSTYEMKKICACQVVEDKGSKMVFRIIRQGKDGNYKNHDFEATSPVASECAPLYCTCTCTGMHCVQMLMIQYKYYAVVHMFYVACAYTLCTIILTLIISFGSRILKVGGRRYLIFRGTKIGNR